jgi:hypothetical protein
VQIIGREASLRCEELAWRRHDRRPNGLHVEPVVLLDVARIACRDDVGPRRLAVNTDRKMTPIASLGPLQAIDFVESGIWDPLADHGQDPTPKHTADLRSQRGSDGGTTLPSFDRATALHFYEAVRPGAFVLGYTDGRSVSTAGQFQGVAQEADSTHEQLFFAVATLKPEWSDPKTHAKGNVTTP